MKQPWCMRLAVHVVLIVLAVPFAMPLIWVLSTSLKADEQVFVKEVITSLGQFAKQWWPSPMRLQNYPDALRYVPFPAYLRNTLMLCALNVVGAVSSSALAAYAFAKLEWRGRNVLFGIVIATMILPQEVRMVPLFTLWRWLGLYGTFAPLVLPAFFGHPFFIFLLRQFSIPFPTTCAMRPVWTGAASGGSSGGWSCRSPGPPWPRVRCSSCCGRGTISAGRSST